MTIPFTRWPEDFARRYREKGYWQDLPLTHILTDHADNDAVAIIDGDRRITYRAFNQAVTNLASALQAQGLHRGETALVQLGNVAEFYITFFALLQIGVAPVNALFSHQRSELNAAIRANTRWRRRFHARRTISSRTRRPPTKWRSSSSPAAAPARRS